MEILTNMPDGFHYFHQQFSAINHGELNESENTNTSTHRSVAFDWIFQVMVKLRYEGITC